MKIVLVEPAGPLNLGSIARVMKNFGLSELTLVNPKCDPLSKEAKQMAVHAQDILESVVTVNSLVKALEGRVRVAATTSRTRTSSTFETSETIIPWLLERNHKNNSQPAALIFGPEDRGLSNEELGLAQKHLSIPTNPDYSTLNLAQAVAICCHDIFRTQPHLPPVESVETFAPVDEIEGYLNHMSSILLDIGYLYPHTKSSRMKKFRELLHRSQPSTSELALLRGVWAQIDWALKNK